MKSRTILAPEPRRRFPLSGFLKHEGAATAVEYGLLVAGLTIAILTAVTAVGANIGVVMNKVSAAVH